MKTASAPQLACATGGLWIIEYADPSDSAVRVWITDGRDSHEIELGGALRTAGEAAYAAGAHAWIEVEAGAGRRGLLAYTTTSGATELIRPDAASGDWAAIVGGSLLPSQLHNGGATDVVFAATEPSGDVSLWHGSERASPRISAAQGANVATAFVSPIEAAGYVYPGGDGASTITACSFCDPLPAASVTPIDAISGNGFLATARWLFFESVSSNGARSLWRTDGTANRTLRVPGAPDDDRAGGFRVLGAVSSGLVAERETSQTTSVELLDGTSAPEAPLLDLPPGSHALLAELDAGGRIVVFRSNGGDLPTAQVAHSSAARAALFSAFDDGDRFPLELEVALASSAASPFDTPIGGAPAADAGNEVVGRLVALHARGNLRTGRIHVRAVLRILLPRVARDGSVRIVQVPGAVAGFVADVGDRVLRRDGATLVLPKHGSVGRYRLTYRGPIASPDVAGDPFAVGGSLTAGRFAVDDSLGILERARIRVRRRGGYFVLALAR